mmetsp:Transcript_73072/g.167573  ORF Transcript_73072/g.167573 Transcript_73072/m.167573 type:complete len:351 (+) Transcript_73072:133-1185(+)
MRLRCLAVVGFVGGSDVTVDDLLPVNSTTAAAAAAAGDTTVSAAQLTPTSTDVASGPAPAPGRATTTAPARTSQSPTFFQAVATTATTTAEATTTYRKPWWMKASIKNLDFGILKLIDKVTFFIIAIVTLFLLFKFRQRLLILLTGEPRLHYTWHEFRHDILTCCGCCGCCNDTSCCGLNPSSFLVIRKIRVAPEVKSGQSATFVAHDFLSPSNSFFCELWCGSNPLMHTQVKTTLSGMTSVIFDDLMELKVYSSSDFDLRVRFMEQDVLIHDEISVFHFRLLKDLNNPEKPNFVEQTESLTTVIPDGKEDPFQVQYRLRVARMASSGFVCHVFYHYCDKDPDLIRYGSQ